jgi:hypothetical protein
MHGTVRDEEGVSWECEWMKVVGPVRPMTRIMLRKAGETGAFTHYYDAYHPADIFEPRMIARAFSANPISK